MTITKISLTPPPTPGGYHPQTFYRGADYGRPLMHALILLVPYGVGPGNFFIFVPMRKTITWVIVAAIGVLLVTMALVHLIPDSKKPVEQAGVTYTQVFNATPDSVKVWVTLGATPGCLQDVTKIPFVKNGSGLQGWFYLAGGDSTIIYAPDSVGFNGVISFGYPPDNCPDSVRYPNGINQYEFIVNNGFQAGQPQESINISCVHGVNCVIRVDILTKNVFNAGPTIPSIASFVNSLDKNKMGLPGVYPYGCTHCTDTKGAPSCIPMPQPVSPAAICQIQRPANQSDGLIKVIYLGDAVPAK